MRQYFKKNKNLLAGAFFVVAFLFLAKKLYVTKVKDRGIACSKCNEKYDISKIKSKNCNKSFKGSVWLISFASGDDVHHQNQRVVGASGMLNCVNRNIMYKNEDIDEEFYNKNKTILSAKRGAGYWLWKPYFINKTLLEIPENDYLIYLDSGVKLDTSAIQIIQELLIAKNKEMAIVELEDFLVKNIKRSVFKYFNADSEFYLKLKRLNNLVSIIKNTPKTRKFYKQLLEKSCVPELIMDEPFGKDEYPEFREHSHDIAVLAMLYYTNKENQNFIHLEPLKSMGQKYVSAFHRRDASKTVNLIDKVSFMDQDKNYPHDKKKRNFFCLRR
jgi:hypothetical protein